MRGGPRVSVRRGGRRGSPQVREPGPESYWAHDGHEGEDDGQGEQASDGPIGEWRFGHGGLLVRTGWEARG